MVKLSFYDLPSFWRKGAALILASSFLLGHLLGVCFSCIASDPFFSAMRAAVSSRVSITGLLAAMVLPFLFSAFAVYIKQPMLLIPIAFVEAFLFSCLGYGIYAACGSAGWLVVILVMFGQFGALPLLYWYWHFHISGRVFDPSRFCLVLAVLLTIGFIDYYWIVPFLADIISF